MPKKPIFFLIAFMTSIALNAQFGSQNTSPIWENDNATSNNSSSGSMNSDADGEIPPPPDDPEDVPIDGGVGILLALGLVSGYQQTKREKKPAISIA
jgi:hypothetical protein